MRYSAFIVFKDDEERRARWHPSPNRTRCDAKKPGTLCIRASGTKRYDDAVSHASSFFLLAVTSLSLSLSVKALSNSRLRKRTSRTTLSTDDGCIIAVLSLSLSLSARVRVRNRPSKNIRNPFDWTIRTRPCTPTERRHISISNISPKRFSTRKRARPWTKSGRKGIIAKRDVYTR